MVHTFSVYLQGMLNDDTVLFNICAGKFIYGSSINPAEINDGIIIDNYYLSLLSEKLNGEREFQGQNYDYSLAFLKLNETKASSLVMACYEKNEAILAVISSSESITDKVYELLYKEAQEAKLNLVTLSHQDRQPYIEFLGEHSLREREFRIAGKVTK